MKIAKSVFMLILSLYLIFSGSTDVCSAEGESDSAAYLNYRTASQYYLEGGVESKLMMKVNVWGAVQKPGAQYVPDGTDLVGVISAAGGPVDGAKLSEIRLIRNFNGEKRNDKINLSRCLKKGEVGLLPEIKPGDTIIIPKSKLSFGKFINVVYNIAVIASVVKLMTD